jgi:hypothetical protein
MNVTQVLKEAEAEVEHWKKFGNNYKVFPLYIHPAKTLTDEEIAKYVKEWKLKELKENSSSTNYVQELAFIDGLTWTLRKAQEK